MEFVNFDLAKKLKEKGFNKHCQSFYVLDNFTAEYIDDCGDAYEVDFEKDKLYLNYPIKSTKFTDKMLIAPIISQVLNWLREEKKIHICIDIYDDGWFFDIASFYKEDTGVYEIKLPYKSNKVTPPPPDYDSFEQAATAGIEYCLDNLI